MYNNRTPLPAGTVLKSDIGEFQIREQIAFGGTSLIYSVEDNHGKNGEWIVKEWFPAYSRVPVSRSEETGIPMPEKDEQEVLENAESEFKREAELGRALRQRLFSAVSSFRSDTLEVNEICVPGKDPAGRKAGQHTGIWVLMEDNTSALSTIGDYIARLTQNDKYTVPGGRLHIHYMLQITRKLLELVNELHQADYVSEQAAGYLHGDLKPQNLRLFGAASIGGIPSFAVLDFGTAKPLYETEEGVSTQGLEWEWYTPGYAPPEARKSGSRRLTRAYDLFSVAAILYAMVKGYTDEEMAGDLSGHSAYVKYKEIQALGGSMRARKMLDAFFVKSFRYDPAGRYQTAAQMIETVDQLLEATKPLSIEGLKLAIKSKNEVLQKEYRRRNLLGPDSADPRFSGSVIDDKGNRFDPNEEIPALYQYLKKNFGHCQFFGPNDVGRSAAMLFSAIELEKANRTAIYVPVDNSNDNEDPISYYITHSVMDITTPTDAETQLANIKAFCSNSDNAAEIVILVDGYDDVSNDIQKKICNEIRDSWIGAHGIQVVIAVRNDISSRFPSVDVPIINYRPWQEAANDLGTAAIERIRTISEERKNVYLTTKANTEGKDYPGIQERFCCCEEITLVNFAGTSFFSGEAVSKAYRDHRPGRKWFYDRLAAGQISCTVILTDPHSFAAKDAADHKMKGRHPTMPAEDIIAANINYIYDFRKNHPKARDKLKLRLTDVCLPYGIAYGNGDSQSCDVMKVDVYSPLYDYSFNNCGDDTRLSFYLTPIEQETRDVWNCLLRALEYIKDHSTDYDEFVRRNMGWLADKTTHIVHRGRFGSENTDHNLNGFWECIKNGCPIEADVLELADGSLLIGRGDTKIVSRTDTDRKRKLSECSLRDLRDMSDDEWLAEEGPDSPTRLEELMTMQEFLNLVSGKVPLVLELKLEASANKDDNVGRAAALAEKILKHLKYYAGQYVIVAANPYAIKAIKDRDCTIPVGQITWEFTGLEKKIPPYYLEMHRDMTFTDVIVPDVIMQKYTEVMPGRERDARDSRRRIFDLGIPVVLWANFHDSAAVTAADIRVLRRYAANFVLEARPDL